jgi:hypothetical protein
LLTRGRNPATYRTSRAFSPGVIPTERQKMPCAYTPLAQPLGAVVEI